MTGPTCHNRCGKLFARFKFAWADAIRRYRQPLFEQLTISSSPCSNG
jgi:hypothetical protein